MQSQDLWTYPQIVIAKVGFDSILAETLDYTIVWPDELGFAPEFLFFVVFKNAEEFQDQFKQWGYIARKQDACDQLSEVKIGV